MVKRFSKLSFIEKVDELFLRLKKCFSLKNKIYIHIYAFILFFLFSFFNKIHVVCVMRYVVFTSFREYIISIASNEITSRSVLGNNNHFITRGCYSNSQFCTVLPNELCKVTDGSCCSSFLWMSFEIIIFYFVVPRN